MDSPSSVEPEGLLLYSQNPAIGPHQVFSYFQVSLVKFLYAFLISPMCGLHAFWLILVLVMFTGKYKPCSSYVPPILTSCHFDPYLVKCPVLHVSPAQCNHHTNPCAGSDSHCMHSMLVC